MGINEEVEFIINDIVKITTKNIKRGGRKFHKLIKRSNIGDKKGVVRPRILN